ncbi:MAG: MFS transporter, partial [Myxococcales bacterium]
MTTENQPSVVPEGAARYALFMLTLAYVLNFIDRQILVIIQEPIKKELLLSDSQLGLLSGFSFALVYITAGIPIAYWADRGNRRNIIVLAVTVWSGMTA